DQCGGPNRVSMFSYDGRPLGEVPLPPFTAVPEIVPMPGDGLLIRATSYLAPDAWFELSAVARPNSASFGEMARLAISSTHPADFSDTEVVREFATSRDGTRTPLSIIRRKTIVL